VGLWDRLSKLRKEAEDGTVVVHLKDGGARYFKEMGGFEQLFLTKVGLFRGDEPDSSVLDAVRIATPESRRASEEKYGSVVGMTAIVIRPPVDGGWVGVYSLLEDGTVERTFHEGGSEGAAGVRRAARLGPGGAVEDPSE
jgi:hypothetical protein